MCVELHVFSLHLVTDLLELCINLLESVLQTLFQHIAQVVLECKVASLRFVTLLRQAVLGRHFVREVDELRLPCHSVLRQFHLAHIGGPVVLRISPLGRADHGSDSAGSLPLLLLRQLDDSRLLIFLQLGVDLSDTLISNSK